MGKKKRRKKKLKKNRAKSWFEEQAVKAKSR